MKKWVQKLVDQIDFNWEKDPSSSRANLNLTDERATILFIIDTLNNHLIEIDSHPTRAVREALDAFSKEVIGSDDKQIEKVLFRFRQYFASHRIAEFSYIQTTFNDFRRIILDFVDQLEGDLSDEKKEDLEIKTRIDHLREAVESNSIETLKSQSRNFIDTYVQIQAKKAQRRTKRVESVKKNLDVVKKQLSDAHQEMKHDHLTGAYNRRSFDDRIREMTRALDENGKHATLVILDIDHFKKVNDTYGHDIGDFVLQECVKMLSSVFSRPEDFLARIGGEEFAILLPDFQVEHAIKKCEEALKKIKNETFVKDEYRINFTVSMGIAQRVAKEQMDLWLKRADKALYQSKNNGRNRYTVAPAVSIHQGTG